LAEIEAEMYGDGGEPLLFKGEDFSKTDVTITI
jgi:uncharacterized protein with PIN domain